MGLFDSILKRFSNKDIDWDDLEEMLVGADLGVNLSLEIIDDLQGLGRTVKAEDILEECRQRIAAIRACEGPERPTNLPE